MSSEMLAGIIGLSGVLVGAIANALGTTLLAKKKFLQDSRYEAYILFLSSLSSAQTTKPDSPERWKAVAEMIEAKSRIALFGSRDVVEKLSLYVKNRERLNRENFEELSDVIKTMRSDVGSKSIPELEAVLMGLLFQTGSGRN